MIQIKFNDEAEFRDCTVFRRVNMNVIMLDFDSDNVSGFSTFNTAGEQLGDFSNYTTIYRKADGYTYYSNDGSQWLEPSKDLLFFVHWDTVPDTRLIPDEVLLRIRSIEGAETNIKVTKADNWFYRFRCLEHEDYFIISTGELTNFKADISKDSVDYTYTGEVITWQDEMEAQIVYTALMTDTLLKEVTSDNE